MGWERGMCFWQGLGEDTSNFLSQQKHTQVMMNFPPFTLTLTSAQHKGTHDAGLRGSTSSTQPRCQAQARHSIHSCSPQRSTDRMLCCLCGISSPPAQICAIFSRSLRADSSGPAAGPSQQDSLLLFPIAVPCSLRPTKVKRECCLLHCL